MIISILTDSTDLKILLDNQTRWNSQYLSIQRALQLKQRIKHFQAEYDTVLGNDKLTEQDWNVLSKIKDALSIFDTATSRVQSDEVGNIGVWLPTCEALLEQLELQRKQHEKSVEHREIFICAQAAWDKLSHYYKLSDQAFELYAAAVLMNPEQKKAYFDKHWKSKELKQAYKQMVAKVRCEWTANAPDNTDLPQAIEGSNFLDQYYDEINPHFQGKNSFDEWLSTGTSRVFSGPNIKRTTNGFIKWWQELGDPNLRLYAVDLLAVPASSAFIERVWSIAGNLVKPRMNRMTDEVIEMRVIMHYNLQKGVVDCNID